MVNRIPTDMIEDRTSGQKLSEQLADNTNKLDQICNVKKFANQEANGDFSPVIQAAMNSGLPIIEFPNWTKTLKSPITVPSTVKEIRFNKAVLYYDKAQVLNLYSESMFVVDGVDDLKVSGGKAEYLGTFDLGSSYAGRISAFHVTNSQRFEIEKFEATKFNNCGINIAPNKTDAYCIDPVIRKCNFHHNRVVGIGFGNTDNIIIEKNRAEYNGIATDSETGYGIAGWRAAYPKNSQILNNQANYNFRKGIDFHSGFNGVIRDNFCKSNYSYGVFVFFENIANDSSIQPSGDWTIENNTITDMSVQSALYTDLYGIAVGSYSSLPKGTSITISKNKIRNFAQGTGNFGNVFHLTTTGLKDGIITISENTVDAQDITSLVRCQEDATLTGTHVDLDIINNHFKTDNQTDVAFNVRTNSRIRNLKINNNEIENIQTYTPTSLCSYADSNADTLFTNTNRFNFENNDLYLVKSDWGNFDPIRVYGKKNIMMFNNFWNGVKYRDWDGYRYRVSNTTYVLTGYWTKGSVVENSNTVVTGTAGSQYVISAWRRLTAGTSNVLNTDWVECRTPTGT